MAFMLLGMSPVLKAGETPAADGSDLILFYVPLPKHETPNFETIQRDAQFTWVANDRLSRDPAMQFTGPGQESIAIDGKMYPYHFGGLDTLSRLRAAGRRGKPMDMVRFYPLQNPSGYAAESIGTFVIMRVRTIEQKIGSIGIAHKIDFTVELTRYGDDTFAGGIIIPETTTDNSGIGA
ncbi:phage tail protein [Bradyrhizobium sp. SZCCHNR3118]|uniref:phage tail protein n=1 Tax=Bradyrhizobium sp. SZCCHNR3118 TaxID=3057468 RepID=UPI0029160AB6|nr:phage tail protein [Bradyrhizobium sp. SZCCHNR3118]